MKKFMYCICIASLALAGCSSNVPVAPSPLPVTVGSTITAESPATHTATTASPIPTGAAPANPVFTTTPDLRLPPEQWKEWPVVPTVSARAREIYQKGLLLGNDSRAFSKIGDCQSIPASFLGIYERPGQYHFSPEYESLQETIDHFYGSFGREGEAVRGGFNAATVLSPMWANTQVCLPGETPVECENRVQNPSIAFISLEVWFSGRTPEVYEKYLRRVIEYNIEQGVLPVLATKADNVEGDHSINYTVAKLAYEYDIPLWNYWLAVQPLPNRGLDPADQTGFHLNVDGWNMRSFSALQVLDAILRAVDDAPLTDASLPAQATVAAPISIFTPGPVDSLPYAYLTSSPETALPGSGIVLGLSKRGGEQLESTGIFTGTLNGAGWQAIAGPDSILIAHSIHGTLTAQKNELYLLKDGVRNLLTNTMHFPSAQPADWLADGRVAVIQNSEGRVRVVMLDPSNGSSVMLDDLGLTPMTLYPSPDPARIYWGAGECNGAGCFPQTILISRTDGSGTQPLPFTGQPAFAADGKMAFVSLDGKNQLTLVSGAGESYSIPLFGNRLTDLAWSPDGNTLAIITAQVSDYSGRVLESRLNFIELPDMVRTVVSATEDVIERAVWSPDGKYMLVVHRAVEEADYRLEFAILDADRQYELQTGGFQLTSSEYLFPHPVYWMP
jgi:hypothetical protein